MRSSHQNLKQKALRDPDTKKYYESLEEKFSIIEEFMRARKAAGKTQLDIAESMDIKASVIVTKCGESQKLDR